MKKILSVTLSGLVALGLAGGMLAGCAVENEPEINLYLAPGVYTQDGEKVENTLSSSGVTALSKEQCAKVNTENAYLCTLEEGETLPVPASGRTDKEGNPYTFNGWWTIVNATVTYYDSVPKLTQTTFLYADWRADLSQRLDPVEPDDTVAELNYYMSIERAETNETETVQLLVSGTDVSNAETLGYSAPVQLYNEWFGLNPGDVISVYTAGLGATGEVQLAPVAVTGKPLTITLENSGAENNDTRDYLEKGEDGTSLVYKTDLTSRHFRIYIKFYDSGATMTVYMQPMD
ncbi:MAG: hypothetical protein K2N30_01700 [Clostridia bacterium]|nr:hypothetical protein [Clostridia bacterium]